MHEKNLSLQASQLAAGTGAVVRTLNMAGPDYEFTRLVKIQAAMAGGMSRSDICSAVDYLADSGYIEVQTVADHRAARVSSTPMESLEVKLTPKGKQLALGVLDDPLVDM